MFFNEESGTWESVPGAVIDATANTISVNVDHFTLFSIVSTYVPPSDQEDTDEDDEDDSDAGRRGRRVIFGTPPVPKNPELPEETPELPTTSKPTTPETEEIAPTGFAAITGAVIGALGGTINAVTLLIIIIGALGVGSYFFFKRKKKE